VGGRRRSGAVSLCRSGRSPTVPGRDAGRQCGLGRAERLGRETRPQQRGEAARSAQSWAHGKTWPQRRQSRAARSGDTAATEGEAERRGRRSPGFMGRRGRSRGRGRAARSAQSRVHGKTRPQRRGRQSGAMGAVPGSWEDTAAAEGERRGQRSEGSGGPADRGNAHTSASALNPDPSDPARRARARGQCPMRWRTPHGMGLRRPSPVRKPD